MSRNNPKYIIIHHAYMNDIQDGKSLERIQKYHMNKGWKNIGYHYVIEYKDGVPICRQGRHETTNGAHTIGFNTKSIGICIVGNYDKHPLELDKKDLLLKLLRYLIHAHHIPRTKIIGHRDSYKLRNKPVEKSCPGNKIDLSQLLEDL